MRPIFSGAQFVHTFHTKRDTAIERIECPPFITGSRSEQSVVRNCPFNRGREEFLGTRQVDNRGWKCPFEVMVSDLRWRLAVIDSGELNVESSKILQSHIYPSTFSINKCLGTEQSGLGVIPCCNGRESSVLGLFFDVRESL